MRWNFDMKEPMSSYLVAITAGDFDFTEVSSSSGIPVQLYYPAGKRSLAEPTYRHTERIFNFLETEIGVPYPWQNYKQVPVQDFLYAGMENTTLTIFSDIFLVDSIGFNDRNYVNVNAHELAHQWFGNFVTAASGEHHWLQEGFSTYYSLLAEKEIFGEDYFYWRLYQSAEELKQLSDSGKGQSLLNPNASSLIFYQKGAWALHILKERIGKAAFDVAIRNYLEKHSFGNVTTSDFIREAESASGTDLEDFVKNWLSQSAFQGVEALESLKESEFIREFMEIASLRQVPLENKKKHLWRALNAPVNDFIGQEVVRQLSFEDPVQAGDLYRQAFKSGNVYVRQAVALTLPRIPQELKMLYETLLDDPSYVTQETALYNLWQNFPQDRIGYLEKMEGAEGFLDKNIRTLWLALSLATPETELSKKKIYLKELRSYTDPQYRFQVREHAFGYLLQIGAYSLKNIQDLVEATGHHNHRFRAFAKDILEQLKISGSLDPKEKAFLEEQLELSKD